MFNKVEIEIELLRDLVDAAGYVSTFHTMFINHETPDNCGDLNAAEYLASEAVLIEQRGRAVLEAVEQGLHPTSETLPAQETLSTPEHSATSQGES